MEPCVRLHGKLLIWVVTSGNFRGTTSDNVTLMFETYRDGNTFWLNILMRDYMIIIFEELKPWIEVGIKDLYGKW